MQMYTCKLQIHEHMHRYTESWGNEPYGKGKSPSQDKSVPVRSCKRIKTQICMDTHRLQAQKQMSADVRLHASHTYAWTHRRRCEPTNVNVLVHLEEYICKKKNHKKTLFLTHGDARRGLTHSAEHEERGNLYDWINRDKISRHS